MANESLVITEGGFLTEFLNQHSQRTDRPFCFVLGAGVSRASGIPTGGELADIWLREVYEAEDFDGVTLEEWATPERLGIPGFVLDHLARFYPQLYRRRYGQHEQAGYAFLESQMEGKEPSFGYSVMAYLLSETAHRVVVTTNFENLVADALSMHASRFPIVIGHDSLAQFATVELRRPLVAKIHGALGFAPKSRPDDIVALPVVWRTALERILERYTPIVIGYEGNDGSLMSFLQSLPLHVPDRILWCVYAPGAKPGDCLQRVSTEVLDYVQQRRGRFVPIRGFDELMAKLLSKLGDRGSVPDLYERLKDRHRQRELSYDNQQRRLFEKSVPSRRTDEDRSRSLPLQDADNTLTDAVSKMAETRKEKPWWVWSEEARNAPNADTKEAIFVQALEACPESASLLGSYASFLLRERKDLDKAEQYYQRALRADPNDSLNLARYADFLHVSRREIRKSEEYYRRSIQADPNNALALGWFARFLEERRDMDAAEEYYQRALKASPDDNYSLRNYASFLDTVRKDRNGAEEHYVRAVAAAPHDAYILRSYARFLGAVPGNEEKADEFEQRARANE
jgi:protein O-mannosyl-transferase